MTSESETFQQKETRRSHQKEAPGQIQTPRRSISLIWAGNPFGVLPDKLEEVAEVRQIWASLLVLLPS